MISTVAAQLPRSRGFCGNRGEDPPHWAMVGYRLADTLPASGAVSRALCVQDADGRLVRLQEILAIERKGGSARWRGADGMAHVQPLESLVSMNLWGFTPEVTAELEAVSERSSRPDRGSRTSTTCRWRWARRHRETGCRPGARRGRPLVRHDLARRPRDHSRGAQRAGRGGGVPREVVGLGISNFGIRNSILVCRPPGAFIFFHPCSRG